MLLLGGTKGYLAIGFIRPLPCKEKPFIVPDAKSPTESEEQSGSNGEETTPLPMGLFCVSCNPNIGNTTATVSSGSGIAFECGPAYPHESSSTIICITSSNKLGFFFAADDKRVISIWAMRKKSSMAKTLSTKNVAPNNAGVTSSLVPPAAAIMQSYTNLSKVDVTGVYKDETILSMKLILANKYLLVSTSNRLLLFLFTTSPSSTEVTPVMNFSSPGGVDSTPIRSPLGTPMSLNTTTSTEVGLVTPGAEAYISGYNMLSPVIDEFKNSPRLASWVELDRGIPGMAGVFCMHVSERFVPVSPGATVAEIKRKYVQWRLTSSVVTQIAQGASKEAVTPKPRTSFSRSFSFSRSAPPQANDEEPAAVKESKKCTLYRFEWTEEMFQSALKKMKPL